MLRKAWLVIETVLLFIGSATVVGYIATWLAGRGVPIHRFTDLWWGL